MDLTIFGWNSTKSVAVAMALHELATNAVKYGALSNGGGRVTISWEQCQANRVKLVWQENGGPMVIRQSKRASART